VDTITDKVGDHLQIYYGTADGAIAEATAEHNRIRIENNGILRNVGCRITGNGEGNCIGGVAIVEDDREGGYDIKSLKEGKRFGGQLDFGFWDMDRLPVIRGQYIQLSIWAPIAGNWFLTYELEVV